MIGHGSPTPLHPPRAGFRAPAARRAPPPPLRRGFALGLGLMLLVWAQAAAQETMRVRVAWGGGRERLWEGAIWLSEGALSQPKPLGIEADEPGALWLELNEPQTANRLLIRQRSARAYDAVEVLLAGPLTATLNVRLKAADDAADPISAEIPLGLLVDEVHNSALDEQGNRLLVRRAPGDRLRVAFARDHLIFTPGRPEDAEFRFTLKPHLLRVPGDRRVRIEVGVGPSGGGPAVSSQHYPFQADDPGTIPVRFEVPQQEGVYDAVISVVEEPNWQRAVSRPLSRDWTIAQRKVQFLVLSPSPPRRAEAAGPWRQVGEDIDPANPGWQEKLGLEKLGLEKWQQRLHLDKLQQITQLQRRWPGLLSSGRSSTRRHPLGPMIELQPSPPGQDPSWEAYRLPVAGPGQPHVLEVEYPSDVEQTLGVSILEVNAAGALLPVALDSGIDVDRPWLAEAGPRRLKHRLLFWPRSKSPAPVVLLCNHRDAAPAAYSKLRVLSSRGQLPPAPGVPSPEKPGRLLLAYYDRPLFPENFSAPGSMGAWVGRTLDDWGTFYHGGSRLIEYLRHAGYNGLMISVLADGSSIYPSAIAEPTPRYDTGAFFETAQDPVRKDVLEMLFRLCDREGLRLVPAVEFAAPLPELEAIRRRGRPEVEGLEWIGPDGSTWCQTHPTHRGLAPYYNVLHPRVQEAMRGVVRELAGRYAGHPSFAGLAVQLSAHGYAQLPGPEWGMDDATLARFEEETQVKVPGTGPARFKERAEALLGPHRRTWLQWRASRLAVFHRTLHAELEGTVARQRPDAPVRLYLAGAGTFDGPELQAALRPALPQRMTLADALLRVGIDTRLYEETPGLVLLRPQSVQPGGSLRARAAALELSRMPDAEAVFRGLPVSGTLAFHPPLITRVPSFDAQSPFQPAMTELFTQAVPSGQANRRRFVRSLAALDSQVIADGGWLLPMGQEESLREVVAAYRQLPATRFEQAGERRGPDSSQPVTFRYATYGGGTYVYAVNEGPFAVTASVRVNAPPGCRLEELTGLRQVGALKRDAGGTSWTVELDSHDLVAVRLSDPGATLAQPRVFLPPMVAAELGRKIQAWGARTAALRSPPPLDGLENPGFEQPSRSEDPLPGWITAQRPGPTVAPDESAARSGKRSVHITAAEGWACLVSRPFPPPASGRALLTVWLKVADAARQPTVRLALEGRLRGRTYYRYAEVGRMPGSGQVVPIGTEWGRYDFPLYDLPLGGLSELRVRVDLQGPGEVWVDDVALYDLIYTETELRELAKLVTLAKVTLDNGQVSDCVELLESYWPQLLAKKLPLKPESLAPVARAPEQSSPKTPESTSQRTGWADRLKGVLPRF